jgi:hypothetical protein
MNIKSNSWNIAITVGVFIAGSIVGRITVPAHREKEPQNVEIAISKAKPKVKHSRSATVTRSSSAASAVTIVPGESMFDEIAAQDFEQMARAAAASMDTVDNKSLLHVLISEWAKKDPLAAIAYAQELGRSELIYEGLRQMAQQNPDEALNWVEQNEIHAEQNFYFSTAIYRELAKADPAGTITRIEQMPADAERDELLSITVDQWVEQDIYAVFDWLETVELTPQFPDIYNQVMGSYIEQDPFQAAALIADMKPGEDKLNFTSQIAYKLAEQNLDDAFEWMQTLDDDERNCAFPEIIGQWSASSDAPAALNYILNHQDTPNYQRLFRTVAVNMAHENPEALADALETMDERRQITAAEQLASFYSVNDPERGIEWLQSLEPGLVQDAALKKALRTYKCSNVPLAFTLSESISSESLRKEQIRQVMSVWVPMDQQAAEQALQACTVLSSSEKERLLNEVYSSLKLNDYLLPAKM